MGTINQLVDTVADIAGKKVIKKHIQGPLGVRGRNSDNKLIAQKLGWKPSATLRSGLEKTYEWIDRQLHRNNRTAAVLAVLASVVKLYRSEHAAR